MTDAYTQGGTMEFVRRFWIEDETVSKHERLKRAFMAAIREGYWQPGARLPSESELTAVIPCSLGTVQKALRDLVSEGLIERRRGSGTIVAKLDGPIEEPWHMRFFDDSGGEDGGYVSVFNHVMRREVTHEHGPWSAHLAQKDKAVVRIERRFVISDRFNVHAIFYALAEQFPELVEMPVRMLDSTNFKLFIARRYRIPVRKVHQTLRFEHPTPEIAKTTGADPSELLPVLGFVAYAMDDKALYYQDFFVPPNELQLDLGVAIR